MIFALALEAVAFAILWAGANLLAACLALSATLFYVFIYSLWLKRTSRQNIVIGGAAGAVPVLVGWAAVQNSLSWEPFIRHADEYKAAGVPMMPSVATMKQTVRQMFIYTVLLTATTLILGPVANLGLIYMISAVILGLGFIASTVDLSRNPTASRAMRVFGFSITYVTVLFTAMAVDVFVKHGI
jgi:protoheme IX farnesyltransferase